MKCGRLNVPMFKSGLKNCAILSLTLALLSVHALQRLKRDGWMPKDLMMLNFNLWNCRNIYSFIEHWHSAVRNQLQDEAEIQQLISLQDHLKLVVRSTPPIRSLTTNPLLCAMLCALNRDRKRITLSTVSNFMRPVVTCWLKDATKSDGLLCRTIRNFVIVKSAR